jgi:Protein of unknown function (DUF2911)
MRTVGICILLVSQLTIRGLAQQSSANTQMSEVVCTFDDGKAMKVQYSSSQAKRNDEFRDGQVWEPGGSPMFLFTQVPLTLGGTVIREGAYSLYIIPEKKSWTLIVNKNASAANPYDEKQDLVRVPMEIGQLPSSAAQFQAVLGHMAPKQCNLRLYYEKTGAFAEMHEK